MILVLLGTQNNDFHRLLDEIEKNIQEGNIKEEVIVQAGFTKYKSNNMKIFEMMRKDDLEKLVQKADLVITHAGEGSIEMSLEQNKKVIAVPRLKKYGEHVNDHQKDIEDEFNRKGWIIGIDEVSCLGQAIRKAKNFKPNKYQNQKADKIVNIIRTFIDMPKGTGKNGR